MKYFLLLFGVYFLGFSFASAQSETDTFVVQVTGDIDATPPTTPTLLAADPVAPTQITLAWSTSTDNTIVSGYNVIRDGSVIATTSLLAYMDTGLAASTTYTYTVRAFDLAVNYSSSSNSIATTTLALPVVPPSVTPTTTTTTSEGTSARVVLDGLQIDSGLSTSSFMLNTARPSRVELRWGRTLAYELGYVVSGVYRSDNSFFLSELEPGTTYEYEIVGYSQHGNETVLAQGSFTTLADTSVLLPPNVSRFTAVAAGGDVRLSWGMPDVADVSRVRVVRSHLGFPEFPADGAIVYQGSSDRATDTGVLAQYSPVYYTAFVYDTYGNISSGAVAVVYRTAAVPDSGPVPTTSQLPVEDVSKPAMVAEATTTYDQERVTPEMKMPQLADITITQGLETFTMFTSPLQLDGSNLFTLSVPVSTVAGNLKSIIATVVDPTDTRKAYSFLLRLNKDQSAYVAIVPPFEVVGQSQLRVEIYDYEAFVVASYQTPVLFSVVAEEAYSTLDLLRYGAAVFVLLFSSVFMIGLFVMWRRRS